MSFGQVVDNLFFELGEHALGRVVVSEAQHSMVKTSSPLRKELSRECIRIRKRSQSLC